MNITNRAAIESACKFVEERVEPRKCDSDAVSSCWRCNSVYLAKRMRELLGVPSTESAPPIALSTIHEWFWRRIKAAGGHITDLSAFVEEVVRWTEGRHAVSAPAQLPESMSRDEMLKYYSEYANVQCNEALRYQQRIRELESALVPQPPQDERGQGLSAENPVWDDWCEAHRLLADIELAQGGSNGPTIRLRGQLQKLRYLPAEQPVALSTLPESVWAKVEAYADAVCEYNTAVRIDVGIEKAGAVCLAIEKELRTLLAASAPAQQATTPQPVAAEVEKDAQRYRWLRERNWFDSALCVVRDPKKSVRLGFSCPSLDRLDDAIDAAMAGTGSDESAKEAK